MNKVFVICISLFLIYSCSNEQRLEKRREWFDSAKTKIKKEYYIHYKKKSKETIQGSYKEYFISGDVKLEGNYLDNEKHGKFILFNEQGVKITEQEFKYGKLDNISKDFYPNGKVKLECSYRNGTLDGPMIEYFENGKPHKIINIENGIKQGESKLFYPSGKLHATLNYKDDKLNGTMSSFDTLGNIVLRKYYDYGRLILEDKK